jgi:hypothetical protein
MRPSVDPLLIFVAQALRWKLPQAQHKPERLERTFVSFLVSDIGRFEARSFDPRDTNYP